MMNRRISRALAWTLVIAIATPIPAQSPDAKRMRSIESAMMERIAIQNDVWFESGEFPRTVQSLRASHEMFPNDYETVTDLGWMLENLELWGEALATYVQYKHENPDNPDAPYPEAHFYFLKKLYAEIPPLLEPSLNMASPPHPNTYRALAHSYDRLGLLADSKRVWESLLKLAPDDGAAKVNLARVERKIKGETPPPAPPETGRKGWK